VKGTEDNVANWMPVYIADLFADTDDLSTEEFGVYLRLLLHMWTRGGVLPNDPQRLSRLARIDRASLDLVWPVVGKFFSAATGGLTQKRLAAELARARKVRSSNAEKAQKGGKASGAVRRQMKLGLEPQVEPQVELEADSETKPESTQSHPDQIPSLRSGSLSLFDLTLQSFRSAWAKIYFEEYIATQADKSQLGRLLNSLRGQDVTLDWSAIFERYMQDHSQWTAGEKRHSLVNFCTSGGLNKYRVHNPAAGYSDKELRGRAAGGKFDEIMDRRGGNHGRPTR
jgi:uncharacterized protein YdaU (DUF1376 family)